MELEGAVKFLLILFIRLDGNKLSKKMLFSSAQSKLCIKAPLCRYYQI